MDTELRECVEQSAGARIGPRTALGGGRMCRPTDFSNVRCSYPVGVNDGKRGGRATTFGSTADSATREPLFLRTPGMSSRIVSSSARNPAHVTQSTPRNSGKRDRGSAAYGFAPVKRRRRPVTDGGVGTRFVGSLIDFPLDSGRPQLVHPSMRTKAMTTRSAGRARKISPRPTRASRSSRARSWCRSSRSNC